MYNRPAFKTLLIRIKDIAAIEVKSGRSQDTFRGMETFASLFKPNKKLLIGGSGISIEEFLSTPVQYWIKS